MNLLSEKNIIFLLEFFEICAIINKMRNALLYKKNARVFDKTADNIMKSFL